MLYSWLSVSPWHRWWLASFNGSKQSINHSMAYQLAPHVPSHKFLSKDSEILYLKSVHLSDIHRLGRVMMFLLKPLSLQHQVDRVHCTELNCTERNWAELNCNGLNQTEMNSGLWTKLNWFDLICSALDISDCFVFSFVARCTWSTELELKKARWYCPFQID